MSCGAVESARDAAEAVRFPLLDVPPETRYSYYMTETTAYYVGDLCYVMHDVWSEVCSLCPFDNSEVHFQLEDGREFYLMSTACGDGLYSDQEGRNYGVDSGTIGAIRVEDIRDELADAYLLQEQGLAQVIQVIGSLENYEVHAEDGLLTFGPVSINTDWYYEDEEEEDEDA